MSEQVVIERRFNGPPESGNGGYVCGVVAGLVGDRSIVIGWPLGEDGRKLYSGTALFSQDGELRAMARATWVRLDLTVPGP